jgi:hypothetical protein
VAEMEEAEEMGASGNERWAAARWGHRAGR